MAYRVALLDWAVQRGRRFYHFRSIDPARTALVAIDMQNALMAPGEMFATPQHAEHCAGGQPRDGGGAGGGRPDRVDAADGLA